MDSGRFLLFIGLVAAVFPLVSGSEKCSPNGIFPCSHTIIGNLLLMAGYGALLGFAAKVISDGSEMLLQIVNPGIIGGFVLPVLGAIPDTAIIVVSCMGSPKEAQEQVAVGVGTLAGSTVMLLTIAWSASMWVARCDIEDGQAVDQQLTQGRSLTRTGVTVTQDVPINSVLMLGTSLTYLVVQGVAFSYLSDPDSHNAKQHERKFALAAFIIAAICFVGYSVFQVLNTNLQEKQIAHARDEARREHVFTKWSFVVSMALLQNRSVSTAISENAALLSSRSAQPKKEIDIGSYWNKWRTKTLEKPDADEASLAEEDGEEQGKKGKEDDLGGKTKTQIALQSAGVLVFGVSLVTVFADPMVEVISEFGNEIGIDPFFVSFVVTPFCSNASELVSSLIFASRKSVKNSTITFSQLLGAACMNNTLGLGCLCGLIYFRDLAWTFSAETMCTLVVIWVVGLFSLRKTFKLGIAIPILLMYAVGLGIVVFLEQVFDWR